MRCALLTVLTAAGIGLAACSSGGAPQAMPGQAVGNVRTAQSCPYRECITLKYGSPFTQEWCVAGPPPAYLDFGSDCVLSSGAWGWGSGLVKVKLDGEHHALGWIDESVNPINGNPVNVTISETRRIKPSRGRILYFVRLGACVHFSGGEYCTAPRAIGIATK
jgi:hypothetical protein